MKLSCERQATSAAYEQNFLILPSLPLTNSFNSSNDRFFWSKTLSLGYCAGHTTGHTGHMTHHHSCEHIWMKKQKNNKCVDSLTLVKLAVISGSASQMISPPVTSEAHRRIASARVNWYSSTSQRMLKELTLTSSAIFQTQNGFSSPVALWKIPPREQHSSLAIVSE